jgi:histidinol-phosphate aminotransferase
MTFNVNKFARKSLLNLKPYKSAREEYASNNKNIILLDANESPYKSEINRYPDPLQVDLKKRISRWKNIPKENIYLSNGSDEFISQVILGFCEPGKDHIIISSPTFLMYSVSANLHGIEINDIHLSKKFELNVDKIITQSNKNSKIIFLASPNNPTGNSFKKKDLIRIIENFPGLIIIDEAYVEFSEDKTLINYIKKYSKLIICQTFSKAQGMAGARVGMTFAHKDIINFLNQIKAPYNLNTLSQKAIMNRINQQNKVLLKIKIILKERKILERKMKKISFIKKIYKTDANFILIKVDNSYSRYNQLIKKGIVVRDSSKNINCNNTLRITIGKPKENYVLIKSMQEIDKIK